MAQVRADATEAAGLRGLQAHWLIEIKRHPNGKFATLGNAKLTAGRMDGRFAGFFPKTAFSQYERDGARMVLEASDPAFYRALAKIDARRKDMH